MIEKIQSILNESKDNAYLVEPCGKSLIEVFVNELIDKDSLEFPDEFIGDIEILNRRIRVYTSAVDEEYDAQIKEITDAIYEYWRESKNV